MLSRIFRTSAVFAVVAGLAACTSVDLNDSATDSTPGSTGGSGNNDVVTVDPNASSMNPFDANSPLVKRRSVFFDFDSYEVSTQYRDTVNLHGNYLRSSKTAQVVLEGNTDVRGSSEYNLALGQRRSEAVRKMLLVMGVPDSQIEAVSFGKEKPVALGNDEASHAQNRRVDFSYRTK